MTKEKTRSTERLYELFREYSDAYRAEWERLERCERLYQGRHWDEVFADDPKEPRPVTPIIHSTVENMKADLMDMMPEAVVTADSDDNTDLSELLTALVNENHRRTNYEREYSEMLHDLLVGGTMVQETGFDRTLNNGMGGAFIRRVDTRGIMFDPFVTDIQDSRAVFKFRPYHREWFEKRYPEVAALMETDASALSERAHDEYIMQSDSESIMLIECWEREFDEKTGRASIHMKRMAGGVVLEDSRRIKPEGYYAHGLYPFTVTPLYERKGTFLGLGVADIFESQQRISDKLDQVVLKNALMASHNKLLVTASSGFDVDDLADWSKEVHMGDSLGGISWFSTPPLPGYMLDYIGSIRNSIKEESGANEFSRGNVAGGITAASAISALQEMSNKRSRMAMKAVHAAFADAVRQELEIEREFCVLPRLIGVGGAKKAFVSEMLFKQASAYDVPVEMHISVKVQRENRFSVIAHNELILQLVKTGIITPAAALELLNFDGREQAQELMKAHAPAEPEFAGAESDPAGSESDPVGSGVKSA